MVSYEAMRLEEITISEIKTTATQFRRIMLFIQNCTSPFFHKVTYLVNEKKKKRMVTKL